MHGKYLLVENPLYLNFEELPELGDLFKRSLEPERILGMLSIYAQRSIDTKNELLIFDEIQSCNAALASLKYFQEKRPDVHIAVAGSLLGLKMSTPGTFPVGKVNLLQLHPMTFPEFLDAIGQSRYRNLIETSELIEPFAEPFHNDLIDLLRIYYFVGGMPEAVQIYISTSDTNQVREVHKEILDTYELDFAKHAQATDIPKPSAVWHSIPNHLARENKRFVFSSLRQSARGRDYADALQWLTDAGLIYKTKAISHVELPLAGMAHEEIFKVYALDIGLLSALANISPAILTHGSEFFQTFHGAFVENYCAQQLIASQESQLYYWKSEGKKAEIDFICEFDGAIFPFEVKAGINTKSKSLQSYDQYYNPKLLIRSSLLNLKHNGKILNIPLYVAGSIQRFVSMALIQPHILK